VSVRGRLLILAAGAVVPLLLVSLATLWGIWIAKQERLNEAIEQQAELAAVVFEHWLDTQRQPLITLAANVARPDSDVRGYLRFVSAPRPAWIDLRLLNAQGETVLAHPSPGEKLPPGLAEKLLAGSPQGSVETDWSRGEGQYVLAVAVPVTGGGAAVARIDGAALKELFRDLQLPEAAALLIARGSARPMARLGRAAHSFGEGDLSARAPGKGNSELAKLGAGFNALAARIEERELRFNELDRLKSEFVSAASHELRTPLTTIKALTRLSLQGGLGEAKQREYPGTIAQECDRQIDLVLNLLDLSRIEAAALEEAPGIGLGLYLAHNIIEQMGGRISVESEVGRGSVFTIHLPVWSDQEPLQLIEEESGDGQTIAGRR
jgi:signal transduction histidine kinase